MFHFNSLGMGLGSVCDVGRLYEPHALNQTGNGVLIIDT